jgi:hypothetical protein
LAWSLLYIILSLTTNERKIKMAYTIEYDLHGTHKTEKGLDDYEAILRVEELEIEGAKNIKILA